MGQQLITDMFSSQRSTPTRKTKSGSPELGSDFVSPYKGNNIDAQAAVPSTDPQPSKGRHEGVRVAMPLTDPQPSKRRGRLEVRIPARSPLADRVSAPPPSSISIPATPDAVLLSSQIKIIDVDDGDVPSVPETPLDTSRLAISEFVRENSPSPSPTPRAAGKMATQGSKPKTPNGKQIIKPLPATPVLDAPALMRDAQQSTKPLDFTMTTLSKPATVFKGNSPFNAIDISSGVDTDCEITLVRVSPKKEAQQQRAPRSKNTERRNMDTSTPQSKDVQMVDRSKSEPPKARQPIAIPRPLPSARTSPIGPSSAPTQARPAIKAKYLALLSLPAEHVTPSRAIESERPSTEGPSRRPLQTPTKKRRINARTPSSAPAYIPTAIVIDNDSDSDDKRRKTPGITSLLETYLEKESTPRPRIEKDTDGEDSEMGYTPSHASQRKILQPKSRKETKPLPTTPSRRLFKTKATAIPASRTSLTPCKTSPIIDLTNIAASDDSDHLSGNDNCVTQTAKRFPLHASQDIYDVPSDQPEQMALDGDADARGVKQEQMALDRDADAKAIKQEHASESSDEDVFYTAPEVPALSQQSTANDTAMDYDARIVKQENRLPSSSPVSYHDTGTGDEDFNSLPPSAQPQEESKFLFGSPSLINTFYTSSEDEDEDEQAPLKTGDDSHMDLSSPISYQSSSDSDGEVNFDIPDDHPSWSQSQRKNHNTPESPRAISRSDSGRASDSDESLRDERPLPYDPYNMPRIGSGGFEPRPPTQDETSYVLQPVYGGAELDKMRQLGTHGNFRPHHRNILIGLKGILKRPQPKAVYRHRPTTTFGRWRVAGLPFLLFKTNKKALDKVVEEALEEAEARRLELEVQKKAEDEVLRAEAVKKQVKKKEKARKKREAKRATEQAAKEAEERAREEEKKMQAAKEAEEKAREKDEKKMALEKRLRKAEMRSRMKTRKAQKKKMPWS